MKTKKKYKSPAQKKKAEAMQGHARNAKSGMIEGTKINNWLKTSGVMDAVDSYEPEKTGDFTKDLIKQGKWLKYKQEMLKGFIDLYASVGGTAANYMNQIKTLEMDLYKLKQKLEEEGKNPLEDKNYFNNLKLLQQMILDANKLNLDVGKAVADYKFKKAKSDKNEDDEFFTVVNEDK